MIILIKTKLDNFEFDLINCCKSEASFQLVSSGTVFCLRKGNVQILMEKEMSEFSMEKEMSKFSIENRIFYGLDKTIKQ